MTREEEIIKQSILYTSQVCPACISGDNIFDKEVRDLNRNKAFEAGAKWADENPKNVWHDADEEPLLENEEIIYVDNTMHAGICSMFGSTFGTWDNDMCWKDYAKHNLIVKWAYINDFLTKGDKDGFKSIL